jgi:hypothetical protein
MQGTKIQLSISKALFWQQFKNPHRTGTDLRGEKLTDGTEGMALRGLPNKWLGVSYHQLTINGILFIRTCNTLHPTDYHENFHLLHIG